MLHDWSDHVKGVCKSFCCDCSVNYANANQKSLQTLPVKIFLLLHFLGFLKASTSQMCYILRSRTVSYSDED